MNITVLGAGNVGCAVAADLTKKGHTVSLVKTSSAMHNENYKFLLENGGRIGLFEKDETQFAQVHTVTNDLSVINEAEIVIVTIQTNYHESLIKHISSFLHDGQLLMFIPGYLSTAYVLRHCGNTDLTIIEGESSPIDCRIMQPGTVKVGFRNVRNPVGVHPNNNLPYVQGKLELFDYHYSYLSSVVESALHNPNLIVHTVGAIMSIPRIEKTEGEYCMYWEVFTPSVWKILEALDIEKMDVLENLGYQRLPYVDACKYRNSLDDQLNAKDVFFAYANSPLRAKGPTVVDSRYISEDVPQGLVLLEALAQHLNVKTPICTSLIELASAALGRDLREEGRTLKKLGEAYINQILIDRE